MKRFNFNLRNVAILFACLAATVIFASCEEDNSAAKNDSAAYWKQWESSMSSQGYTKGWPKELLENRLHNTLADTLRLVLGNKDLVYYMYSPEDIRDKLYMYMRVSKAAVCDTFINVTGRDDRWTLANSITEKGFAARVWLGREGTDIAYYVLEMYCSDSPYTEKIIQIDIN
jgi:hypothetical protein